MKNYFCGDAHPVCYLNPFLKNSFLSSVWLNFSCIGFTRESHDYWCRIFTYLICANSFKTGNLSLRYWIGQLDSSRIEYKLSSVVITVTHSEKTLMCKTLAQSLLVAVSAYHGRVRLNTATVLWCDTGYISQDASCDSNGDGE